MDEVLVFWPLEAKTELSPFEEAAVRTEAGTGGVPEEHLELEAAQVNSLFRSFLDGLRRGPCIPGWPECSFLLTHLFNS